MAKAKSSDSGTPVSSRIASDVLTALDRVAKAEHVNRSVYIARCICQDPKIQQVWLSGQPPNASPRDAVGLALASAIAGAVTSLDRIAGNIEDCVGKNRSVDMFRLVDEHMAIRSQLDALLSTRSRKGRRS